MGQSNIRNFAIVAHIDHGKSTLADRLLEATGTIEKRHMMEQVLDSNPIERERGITIKLAPVRMKYKGHEGSGARVQQQEYILNLIDTPGHVDFSYEVSRSLAACEGVILIVDATQGIQAQTLAHMQLIKQRNLHVIPVINKIDLPSADVSMVEQSLFEVFGFAPEDSIKISAKEGIGVHDVLDAIVERIPPPQGNPADPLRALVFSSVYDSHRGVIVFVRIIDGVLEQKNPMPPLTFCVSKASFHPLDIGFFMPEMKSTGKLSAGDVGYIATGLKDLRLARVGDTIGGNEGNAIKPLPGYQEPKPMVYLSFFPTDTNDFQLLRESFEKLHLSDSSFTYVPRSSAALGKGFLCGFLGLLHAEVVVERLEKEFQLNVIATAPTVEYTIELTSGQKHTIHSPEDFPDPSLIASIYEPIMYTTIYTTSDTVGNIMQLCQEKRGEMINLEYVSGQAKFTYIMPLSEMIVDFFDKLKSTSAGYASLEYEFLEMRAVDAVKLDVLVNKKIVDAFSQIVVRERAQAVANALVERLKELIPRHQFQVPIQAVIGGNVLARSDVKSFRKDVTQKLYGGDRTRKDKLLEAQKKGKKRMKQFGQVEIPQEAFLEVYKRG